MRLYLDTEFNGFGGELISMALVAEDGREWYGFLPALREWEPWVREHVYPVIHALPPTIFARNMTEFRLSLHTWLKQFQNPTIIADWYTDFVHFFSAFDGRDHTESFQYSCRTELTMLEDLHIEPEFPHNALSDARALRDALMFEAMTEAELIAGIEALS